MCSCTITSPGITVSTLSAGAHSIKAGGTITRLRENTWAPFQVAPQWVFSNLTSFMQGNAVTLNGQVSDAQNPGADSTKDYRLRSSFLAIARRPSLLSQDSRSLAAGLRCLTASR